jgi:NAD(P)-dependent dehydrogenase (short-subunit alcohol dehydrogenase family)
MEPLIKAKRLHSKNVVVIGGSKGVGRAIVAASHAEGTQVLAVARQEKPLLKLADEFPGVQLLQLDATFEDFIKGMPSPQTPEEVAHAVVEFASNPKSREGKVFLISGKGIEALP